MTTRTLDQLLARGIRDPLVLAAMRNVPREKFVSAGRADLAYMDGALPIGEGQTISQPYVVAAVTEALSLACADRVLEIGTGSGYSAAILGEIAAEVYTIERVASLGERARQRLAALGYRNVHVLIGDGTQGWPEHAPYDAIVATAGAPRIPKALLDQLAVGGRLVIPLGPDPFEQTLVRVTRPAVNEYRRRDLDAVAFVPLIGAEAWMRAIFPATSTVVSNDTSGACGWAPLSPTEQLVLEVEQFLNGAEFKARFPDTGQDVKVFGVRADDRLTATIAMPLFCADIPSEAMYFARKDEILGALTARFRHAPLTLEWRLNNLDTCGRGADGVYLTVTGTSAEDADSGQVGRGNRVGGLIAHARPTSGEAAAGKNAVAHTGKIYSVLSQQLAARVHARCPVLRDVYVHLMARIGEPVDRPWAGVQVVLPHGMALGDVEPAIREVIQAELAGLATFREALLRGEHGVC